jgi:hypothetical protein
MESWTHKGVCHEYEYDDSIEAVVEECANAEDKDDLVETDICEAPHLICQIRRHSGTKTRSPAQEHRTVPSNQVIMFARKKIKIY